MIIPLSRVNRLKHQKDSIRGCAALVPRMIPSILNHDSSRPHTGEQRDMRCIDWHSAWFSSFGFVSIFFPNLKNNLKWHHFNNNCVIQAFVCSWFKSKSEITIQSATRPRRYNEQYYTKLMGMEARHFSYSCRKETQIVQFHIICVCNVQNPWYWKCGGKKHHEALLCVSSKGSFQSNEGGTWFKNTQENAHWQSVGDDIGMKFDTWYFLMRRGPGAQLHSVFALHL